LKVVDTSMLEDDRSFASFL